VEEEEEEEEEERACSGLLRSRCLFRTYWR
jgi:hypothetical protein